MSRFFPLFFLATVLSLFVFQSPFGWAIEKYCYQSTSSQPQEPVFISATQRADQISSRLRNQMLEQKMIYVRDANDHPMAHFVLSVIQTGDCILLNPAEKTKIAIVRDTTLGFQRNETFWQMFNRFRSELLNHFKRAEHQELFPIVFFRKQDGSKSFGLIQAAYLNQLTRDPDYRESSLAEVLEFQTAAHVSNSLTLVYLVCPPNRDETCQLSFKKNGKWIKNSKGKKIQFQVLARAKRDSGQLSTRLNFEGDAPQGVYYFWATMFSEDPAYGKIPRIDIDAALPPINAWNYPLNANTLSQILPSQAWDQYWANEWPLAYSLGRSLLRIHANSVEEKPPFVYSTPNTKLSFAEGCINVGSEMPNLLSTLSKLGVFEENDIHPVQNPNSKTLEWKVSPSLGRAFLIVKDL